MLHTFPKAPSAFTRVPSISNPAIHYVQVSPSQAIESRNQSDTAVLPSVFTLLLHAQQ